MSLILEALRKSEAERRRGLPPDLRAELPPAPARRGRAGMIGAAAVGIVLVAFAAWFALREPAMPPAAARQDSRATPPASAPRHPQPPLPARTPEAPRRAEAPVIELPVERGRASPPPSSTAATAAEPRPSPTGTPASVADVAPVPESRAGSAEQAPASPAPFTPPPPAEPSAGEGRVLSLAELDPGTRGALPPLKLTMHLWNPQPERRFVILDGQRLGEGDRIGEARIARIERDGVLLEWHGRGIHVPVR